MDEGASRSLSELVTLSRSEFDRGIRSFDYEQSALFIRFLILDPDLGPRFRGYLAGLAAGDPSRPQGPWTALAGDETSVSARFEEWLSAFD